MIGARMICEICQRGTYSLISDVTTSTKCIFCDGNSAVQSCAENVLALSSGNIVW